MKNSKIMLILLSVTAIWGASFILMKNIANAISPLGFLSLRFGVAAIVLCLIFNKKLKEFDLRTLGQSSLLALFLISYMVMQIIGLRYTSASNSGFITGFNVLMVPIFATLLLKKKPTLSNSVGIGLAAIGFLLITGVWDSMTPINRGDVLTFGCAVICALHIILIDRMTEKSDPLLLGIGQTVTAAVFSFIAWFISEPSTFASVNYTPALWTSVMITGVFCTAYCFTVQVVMQKYVSPSRLALIFLFEPVFALCYALIIPGMDGQTETLTAVKAIGCLIIVMGMLVSEMDIFSKLKREKVNG